MNRTRLFAALRIGVLLALLAPANPGVVFGQGRVDPRIVGEWTATVAGSPLAMVFHIGAGGECGLDEEVGTCQTANGRLVFSSPSAGSEQYAYMFQDGNLVISGGDMVMPLVFRRISSAGAQQPAPTQSAEETDIRQTPAEEPPRTPPARSMKGTKTPPAAPSGTAPRKHGLKEAELTQLLDATVPDSRLRDLVEERGVAFAVTPAVVSRLRAKGASDQLIATLRKAASSQPSETAALAGPSSVASRAAGRAPVYERPAGGPRFSQPHWGVSFVPPPGWKVGDRGSLLLLGSDTEAGVMIVRFMRKTSPALIQQSYAEGLAEEGVQLMPTTPIQNFAAGGYHALAGEMVGNAQDGSRLRARTIAILSPYGDAAVIMGVTSDAKYPELKPRVEQLAVSMAFTRPQRSSATDLLAGKYWYFSSSSVGGSYSSERKVTLCSDGRFFSGSESYSSGQAGIAAGQGGSGGTWSAEGDETQGMLTITYQDGSTDQQEYQVSTDPRDRGGYGPAVIVGGRKYQRTGDGSCR